MAIFKHLAHIIIIESIISCVLISVRKHHNSFINGSNIQTVVCFTLICLLSIFGMYIDLPTPVFIINHVF